MMTCLQRFFNLVRDVPQVTHYVWICLILHPCENISRLCHALVHTHNQVILEHGILVFIGNQSPSLCHEITRDPFLHTIFRHPTSNNVLGGGIYTR
jgi:hypothetical protein